MEGVSKQRYPGANALGYFFYTYKMLACALELEQMCPNW